MSPVTLLADERVSTCCLLLCLRMGKCLRVACCSACTRLVVYVLPVALLATGTCLRVASYSASGRVGVYVLLVALLADGECLRVACCSACTRVQRLHFVDASCQRPLYYSTKSV